MCLWERYNRAPHKCHPVTYKHLTLREATIWAHIRTRSAFSNKWLFNRSLAEMTNCLLCGACETVLLFVFFCEYQEKARRNCGLGTIYANTPEETLWSFPIPTGSKRMRCKRQQAPLCTLISPDSYTTFNALLGGHFQVPPVSASWAIVSVL